VARYQIEFYGDEHGNEPVRRWLREELTLAKRRALGYAMQVVLQRLGVAVCGTEFGKPLGGGLFEFRLRSDLREHVRPEEEPGRCLFRVFCHAHGNRLILLLAGYDKGEDPSPRRQSSEIAIARARLRDWQRRQPAPGRR
jgi:putative component of toxin-antitoxin plasmid stabilization module